MVKKVFTLFVVSCFLLNTVCLNVLTASNPWLTVPNRETADFTNKPSGFGSFLDDGQKEEIMNTINEAAGFGSHGGNV